jgi:hypothetical protein
VNQFADVTINDVSGALKKDRNEPADQNKQVAPFGATSSLA